MIAPLQTLVKYVRVPHSPLYSIAIGMILIEGVGFVFVTFGMIRVFSPILTWLFAAMLLGMGFAVSSIFSLIRGYRTAAVGLLCFSIVLPIVLYVLPVGISHANIILMAMMIPLIISGLYVGRNGLIGMAGSVIGLVAFLLICEQYGWFLWKNPTHDPMIDTITIILIIVIATWVIYCYLGELEASRKLMREYERERERLYAYKYKLEGDLARRTLEMNRAIQDAQVARQSAAHADATRNVFVATTSHELRTPLHAIIAMSKFIRKDGPLNHSQETHLERVLSNAKMLLSLISDILDLSKIEAGQIRLDIQPVDIAEIVDDALRDLDPIIHQKRLDVRRQQPTSLPQLYGDPARIQQVMINLISNAVKFTKEGFIEVAISVRGPMVAIDVIDTGIGISQDDQETIFTPFHQAQRTLAREYNGTGLGLAISKLLTEMHGGSIGVQSTIGQGSTFTILLPIGFR